MKKLLLILAAVGLTSTAAISVVACGNKDKVAVVETGDLNELVLEENRNVLGSADMNTAVKALAAFLKTKAGQILNKDHIQVKAGSFIPAQLGSDGEFTIVARSGFESNYTGELRIVIKGDFKPKKLESVVAKADRQVVFTVINSYNVDQDNADDILNVFLAIPGNDILQGEVEVKSGDGNFVPISFPDLDDGNDHNINEVIPGKLVIQAKSGSNYTGELTIVLKYQVVSLESIRDKLTTEIQGSENMTEGDAFVNFISLPNNEFLHYEVVVKEGSFRAPTADEDGQFVIVPEEGNFIVTGQLTITIITK